MAKNLLSIGSFWIYVVIFIEGLVLISLNMYNLDDTNIIELQTLMVLAFTKFLKFWGCLLQMFIFMSCTIAVGTNLSQFICIGRFTAVSFQVLGHMKTILVLIMGFFFFGREGLNVHVVLGMIIAVCGMIWYGNASSKPGGKERLNHSLPTNKTENQ